MNPIKMAAIAACSVLALACSSGEDERPNALDEMISSTPECAGGTESAACKDRVGELIFRGVVFNEGPAAENSRSWSNDPRVKLQNVDSASLSRRVSEIASSRDAYCKVADCAVFPGDEQQAGAESLSTLAEVVAVSDLNPGDVQNNLNRLLEGPNSDAIVSAMRVTRASVFSDFASNVTSGNPLHTSDGIRDTTDVMLASIVPALQTGSTIYKAGSLREQAFRDIRLNPAGDTVVEIETAIYVAVAVAVAVAVVAVVVVGEEDPYSQRLSNSQFIADVNDRFDGALSVRGAVLNGGFNGARF